MTYGLGTINRLCGPDWDEGIKRAAQVMADRIDAQIIRNYYATLPVRVVG